MINFTAVFLAFSNVFVCKVRKSEVKFAENGNRGLGFKIVVSCEDCEKTEIASFPFVEKGYEINRRIVLAMRLFGIGLYGVSKFCAFMELPRSIFYSSYSEVIKKISITTDAVFKNSMMRAAKEEKTISIERRKIGS